MDWQIWAKPKMMHSQLAWPSGLIFIKAYAGYLSRMIVLKAVQKTEVVHQVILIDLWRLLREVRLENKFWLHTFFLQSVNLYHSIMQAKRQTDEVHKILTI